MNQTDRSYLPWYIAAGIVGADIGTSVFYSTGILFPMVGYMAPVFILGVCLMMWLFKSTYQEGLAMSPYNGGAYVMILRTLGRQIAVPVGALTCVSYLATAAVSALSGAFYMFSLFPQRPDTMTIVLVAMAPIVIFGFLNARGIKEPAKIVTAIAGFHFFLLIIMCLWSLVYLLFHPISLSQFVDVFTAPKISPHLFVYGFAAAFLGITGFEATAQIVEQLAPPVNRTVHLVYKAIVVLVSLTAPLISFFCLAILSETEIAQHKESLLSGLGYALGGKFLMNIVVFDATLTLFAAVNTAFVGFIGLATTMAKQGNLPQIVLKQMDHRYPSIQGYPIAALSFAFIACMMAATVAGQVERVAEVYGMAFIAVMISFCLGVVVMRNRAYLKHVDKQYLSNILIKVKDTIIPVIPAFSALVLLLAELVLLFSSHHNVRSLLLELVGLVTLVMAFFRWGVLEKRIATRSDLRLGLGRYAGSDEELPENLPKKVLCTSGYRPRRLINKAIQNIMSKMDGEEFELIIFHAEEDGTYKEETFIHELLQRVVSQQIAPALSCDAIITVRISPGDLTDNLVQLKKQTEFDTIYLGTGSNPLQADTILEALEAEVKVNVVNLGTA